MCVTCVCVLCVCNVCVYVCIVKATVELDKVVRACGLTISILKTKLLVSGRNITQNDLDPISIGGGTIETVSSFHYLGSVAMEVLVRN